MPTLKGKKLTIVPRVPYVPIEPWEWFKENGIEDKMGGPPPMGEGPKMIPSVYIKDGKIAQGNAQTLYGGEITETGATDVRIVAYDGSVGGIYAEGPGTDYTVEGAVISLSGDGQGLGGMSAGAGVDNHAKLTLKDCLIDTYGENRTSTSAGGGSVLRVYDSILVSHGAPYGDDCPGEPPRTNPPAPLEIQGNNRTIGFSNCERYFAKGTRGISGIYPIPELKSGDANGFLTKLFGQYQKNIEHDAEEYAGIEERYQAAMKLGNEILDAVHDADTANLNMEKFKGIPHELTSKQELSAAWTRKMRQLGLTYSADKNCYEGGTANG